MGVLHAQGCRTRERNEVCFLFPIAVAILVWSACKDRQKQKGILVCCAIKSVKAVVCDCALSALLSVAKHSSSLSRLCCCSSSMQSKDWPYVRALVDRFQMHLPMHREWRAKCVWNAQWPGGYKYYYFQVFLVVELPDDAGQLQYKVDWSRPATWDCPRGVVWERFRPPNGRPGVPSDPDHVEARADADARAGASFSGRRQICSHCRRRCQGRRTFSDPPRRHCFQQEPQKQPEVEEQPEAEPLTGPPGAWGTQAPLGVWGPLTGPPGVWGTQAPLGVSQTGPEESF